MPTMTKATKQEYIAWVQRSLNRLPLGDDALVTNGEDSSEYRAKVRAYKALDKKLGSSDEVDAKMQNALIKGSAKATEYVTWLQLALEEVGVHDGRMPTGKMDSATKTAIKSFQAFAELGDDGWIGPDTETVLIQRSGMYPPGHFAAPVENPAKLEHQASVIVSGEVPNLVQNGRTCWAAAFGMMHGWKSETKNIRAALDAAGEKGWFTQQYDARRSLSEAHTATLATRLGLKGETKLPENWAAALAEHGPLMVAQDPGVEGWIHWIVVTGWRKTFSVSDRARDFEELQYNEPFNGASEFKSRKAAIRDAESLNLSHYRWFHF
jgi:peptidoglycan hydrolase-like protein with peptidoglycan-binding domain